MGVTLDEIARFEDTLKVSDESGYSHAVCQESGRPWLVWMEIGVQASDSYAVPSASVDHIVKKHRYIRTWQNQRTQEIEATSGVLDHEESVRYWFDEESWRILRQNAWAEVHHERKSIGSGVQEAASRDVNRLLLTDGSSPELEAMEVHGSDRDHTGSEPHASGLPTAAPIRLRLLIATSRRNRYRFTRNVMQILAQHMNLSVDHLKRLNGYRYISDMMTWGDGHQDSFLTRLHEVTESSLPIITCRYDSETNITHGLLIIHDSPGPRFVEDFVSSIARRCNFAEDPFMAPLVLADCLSKSFDNYLTSMQEYIGTMRKDLGLSCSPGRDPLESDFISSLKRIDQMQDESAHIRHVMNCDMLIIKKLDKASIRHSMIMNAIATARRRSRKLRYLELYTEEVNDEFQRVLSVLERNNALVAALQQLVSNFMAIKESRVNGELAKGSMMIAEATMKDSSAMKSIAVLTMLFLPSTAVAAIFDTPFFEWSGERSEVATRNFSQYWQISAPLTIGIMLFWFLIVRPEKEWYDKVKRRYLEWRAEGVLVKWRDYVSGDRDEETSFSRRERPRSKTRTGPKGYITNGEEFARIPVRSSTLRSVNATYGGQDIRGFIMDRAWQEMEPHARTSRSTIQTDADQFELGDIPDEATSRTRPRSGSRERKRPDGTEVVTRPEERSRSSSGELRRPGSGTETTQRQDSSNQSSRGRRARRSRRKTGIS